MTECQYIKKMKALAETLAHHIQKQLAFFLPRRSFERLVTTSYQSLQPFCSVFRLVRTSLCGGLVVSGLDFHSGGWVMF